MTATLQPRPMRAKHLFDKDPVQREKNLRYLEDHLKTDGYLFQQPKIDGMRILMDDGTARSRTWLPWTQRHLQAFAKDHADLLHGWDGEGVPGLQDLSTPDPEVFRKAMSGVRAEDGSPELTYFIFDNWDPSWQRTRYEDRLEGLRRDLAFGLNSIPDEQWEHGYDGIVFKGKEYTVKVIITPTVVVRSLDEILSTHSSMVASGWEGSMLRRRVSPYKYNQATVREGWLIKLKDTEDDEAVIVGFEPAYENANEATVNALGLTQRSAHQGNLIPKDYLGAYNVQLLRDRNIEFNIGVLRGYTIEDRRALLQRGNEMLGKIIKFEHQGYGGGYDKPRTPVMVSFRDAIDV